MALLVEHGVTDDELQKAKNKITAGIEFEDMSILNRANNLAFYELLGNANLINEELERYNAVTADMLKGTAAAILRPDNCSTLYYKKKNDQPVA